MAQGVVSRPKLIIALCCLVTIGGLVAFRMLPASNALQAGQQPDVIECDLGDVPPSTRITKTLSIPNKTNSLLTIKSVSKDCSCVSQHLDRTEILPNESAVLTVQYNAPIARGPFHHVIEVSFADNKEAPTVFLSGTVGAWAEVQPATLNFSEVRAGHRVSKELIIEVTEPWPDPELTMEVQLEYGQVLYQELENQGKRRRIILQFSPPCTADCKDYRGELIIHWNTREGRVLRIPCIARVISECVVVL
jgi:hypothetical protein